jgi:fatty acyl-ACP thioesterase B
MNQETRRLSKIPEPVRQEVLPFYLNRVAVAAEKNDSERIDKLTDATAERIRSGLAVSVVIISAMSTFSFKLCYSS